MQLLLGIIMIVLSVGEHGEPKLTRVGPGVQRHFGIDMISPSPMSDPHDFVTQFNWPDTLNLSLSITSNEGDTLFVKTYPSLVPGLYRFSWAYRELGRAVKAELNINATDRRKISRFTFKLVFPMM
jgi:hypothetical protein